MEIHKIDLEKNTVTVELEYSAARALKEYFQKEMEWLQRNDLPINYEIEEEKFFAMKNALEAFDEYNDATYG